LKWVAAVTFREGGVACVGAQGDRWDAQAGIAMGIAGWGLAVGLRTARHGLRNMKPIRM